ncbi:MAG TPA: dihydrofolate reductase family protein [Candidatus Aquilonibacter sp.]|nr:dihydrofolate reductase family protein [Candidatus Aquilonibacter sp.]
MRKIRYAVASSVDGYITGPKGDVDWIVNDPAVDFGALMAQFDALLVGRHTFEMMMKAGRPTMAGMETFVFSRTLGEREVPKSVSLVNCDHRKFVETLRARPGKDIWLFGGGSLFASLLGEGLVDSVEVSIMPVLLGGGVPLSGAGEYRARLQLEHHKIYPTGIVSLKYRVLRGRSDQDAEGIQEARK